jgi:uncharacterized protein YggE
MGILPLQFQEGEGADSLGFTGKETFSFELGESLKVGQDIKVTASNGTTFATTGYSIRTEPRGQERPPKERGSGFVARNGIRVTVRALDRVGATIDAALAGGANQVDDVAFRLADDRTLRQKALALAVERARSQAQAMATAAGGKLGPLIELSSLAGRGEGPQMFAARAAGTPIGPGDIVLVEQVVARWRFIPEGP